jgi:hypothetical protein
VIRLLQTLHGYSAGHRLLAHSPEVPAEALEILDRMTDLTGYLPMGFTYTAYHQGFPCGSYYAFTTTWPDAQAPRAGAVLTHTLLIPLAALMVCPSPAAFTTHHRRPASAADVRPYEAVLEVAPPTAAPPPAAAELLALYFGVAEQPILRVTPATDLALVAGLWATLPPRWRAEFRFCTLALHPIRVGGRPFDFFQCPPQAVSGFHSMASSPAWWDPSRPSAVLPRLLAEPWLERARMVGALLEPWEADGVAITRAQVPALLRFQELAGVERLAAARGAADLLARLDPQGRSREWRPCLERLIDLQGQAPEEGRVLWDLQDLLKRPQLPGMVQAHLVLAEKLATQARDQIAARLRAEAVESLREIQAGLRAALGEETSTRCLEGALRGLDDPTARAVVALGDDPLAVMVLEPRSSRGRIDLIGPLALDASRVKRLALQLEDWRLHRASWSSPPTPDEIDETLGLTNEDLREVLEEASNEARWGWATQTHSARPQLPQVAADAAKLQRLTPDAITAACRLAPRGVDIVFEFARDWRFGELRQAIETWPELAVRFFTSTDTWLREKAMAAVSDELLLSHVDAKTQIPYGAQQRVAVAIMRGISMGLLNAEAARDWLNQTDAVSWIRRCSQQERDTCTREPGAIARWLEMLGRLPITSTSRVDDLSLALASLIGAASAQELATHADVLIAFMDSPSQWRQPLASFVTHAVRRLTPPRSCELLVATFYWTWHSIEKRSPWTIWSFWPFGLFKDEDEWVKWLARFWQDHRCSRATLARCAGPDDDLRRQLLKRFDG